MTFFDKKNIIHGKYDPSATHIPSLDGIRGLAILLVVWVHAYYRGPDIYVGGTLKNIFVFGWTGVELFFVLSGFLISSILIRNKGHGLSSLKRFYIRRFSRIMPLYYAILGSLLLFGLFNFDVRLNIVLDQIKENFVFYLLFVSNWFEYLGLDASESSKILGVTWSLSIEEQFYVFWPIVVFLLPIRFMRLFIFLMLIAGVFLRVILYPKFEPVAIYHWTFTRLDGLLLGALLATFTSIGSWDTVLKRASPLFFLASLSVLLGLFFFAGDVHYENRIIQTFGYFIVALFWLSVLLLSITNNKVGRFFSNEPLVVLGKYSYCIYLVHAPIVHFADHLPLPSGIFYWLVYFAFLLVILVGVGMASDFLIEGPIRRWARGL